MCNHIYGLFDCANGIYVDVGSYTSFSAITSDPPITNGNLVPAKSTIAPATSAISRLSRSIISGRSTSLLGNNLSNVNAQQLASPKLSTAVFRNEPYHIETLGRGLNDIPYISSSCAVSAATGAAPRRSNSLYSRAAHARALHRLRREI